MNTSIHNSVAAGVTYVVAAGNSAKDASTFSPANHPDVIAVSAIVDTDGKAGGLGSSTSYGADDTFASFSNYGSAVDIAAPGVKIYSTYKGGSYATMSGTSMASPHVAGAAAIYLVNNPEATPSQLVNALQSEGISFGNASYFSGDTDGIHEALLYAANL
jgi:subtilisin family serine protease